MGTKLSKEFSLSKLIELIKRLYIYIYMYTHNVIERTQFNDYGSTFQLSKSL